MNSPRQASLSFSLVRRSSLLGIAIFIFAASALPAQHVPRPLVSQPFAGVVLADDQVTRAPMAAASSAGRPIAGALLGGAAGVLIGGIAGAFIGGNRCSDPGNPDSCLALGGLLVGSGVGVTLGAPIGAHLLNRRQGALPVSILASAAIAGAGLATLWATDRLESHQRNNAAQLSFAVAVPILQVVSAAIIEQRTSGR